MLSATLWVDPASTHAGDFHTIQSAVNAATPGDTIKVAPGVYAESVIVAKTLTIIGGQVHLAGETGPSIVESDTASFTLSANGVTIKGFTIEPETAAGDGTATGIATDAVHSGDTFQNNMIEDELDGIALNGPTSGTVQTSTVSNNQFSDNQVAIASTLGLSNAKISGNTFSGDVVHSIELDGPNQSNVQIVNNQFTDDAPTLVANTSGSKIDNNTVTNPDGDAVFFAGGVTGTEVANNQFTTTITASLQTGSDGIDVISAYSTAANDNNRFANNVVNGFGYGLFMSLSPGNTIVGNTIENSVDDGIQMLGTANDLSNNTVNDSGNIAFDILVGGSMTLANNTANYNGTAFDLLSGGQVTLTGNTANHNGTGIDCHPSDGAIAIGNTVNNNTYEGIFIGTTTAVVKNNTANGNAYGIDVDADTATITGNTTNKNSQFGIFVAATSVTITGNTADGNADDGFYLGVGQGIITGNTADRNADNGFYLSIGQGKISGNTADANQGLATSGEAGFVIIGTPTTVSGNTALNNAGDGFLFQTVDGSTFLGNTANNNGGDGIHLVSCQTDTLTGNTAKGNANDGFDVDLSSSGNIISRNTALRNTVDDLFDNSTGTGTAGTANTWSHNTANTRNPTGLQ